MAPEFFLLQQMKLTGYSSDDGCLSMSRHASHTLMRLMFGWARSDTDFLRPSVLESESQGFVVRVAPATTPAALFCWRERY